jgi:hypothetical protein
MCRSAVTSTANIVKSQQIEYGQNIYFAWFLVFRCGVVTEVTLLLGYDAVSLGNRFRRSETT